MPDYDLLAGGFPCQAVSQAGLQKATEDVKKDDSVRVVIITGSGRGFSAGADLSEKRQVGKVLRMHC